MKKQRKLTKRRQGGITLIALVVTIVVLLILAGTSIAMLTGDDGIITNSQNSKISTELSEYKEQLELYISNKKIENMEFNKETLFASKDTLRYNTQEDGETGTIKTICPGMKSNYVEKIQIKKGKLILDTKDKREIKIAVGLGIEVNPYEIEDGELIASDDNLLLIDSNGTLKLPESVTTIGEGAFANTASDGVELRRIIIPSTVKEIKANAFNGNSQVEEVVIETKNGKGVTTIGDFAFANCTKLKQMQMPDTVSEIGKSLFFGCSSLENVKISKNITEIAYQMFHTCSLLTEIEVPEGVTIIEAGAFNGCKNLNKITLPSTLQEIVANSFASCSKLKSIDIHKDSNYIYENGILMNKEKTEMRFISSDVLNSDTFYIPDGIEKLEYNIFQNESNIKKIVIPASVTFIEVSFFTGHIEEIEIDEDNPKYMVSNNNIYSKDKKTLYMSLSKDKELVVEEGVEVIGAKALSKVKSEIIHLPDSLKKIEYYGIWNNYTKKITIGKNIQEIARSTFLDCRQLTDVQIDSKNPLFIIEDGIIYNKAKTEIIVVAINKENYKISNGVTEIPYETFSSMNKMKSIVIPGTITKIGNNAFSNCTELTKIEIPSSVTSIGENCFINTRNLKEIVINKPKGSIAGAPWGNMYGDRAIIWNK